MRLRWLHVTLALLVTTGASCRDDECPPAVRGDTMLDPEFVLVEPGRGRLGTDDPTFWAHPPLEIEITRPFWIQTSEVTRGEEDRVDWAYEAMGTEREPLPDRTIGLWPPTWSDGRSNKTAASPEWSLPRARTLYTAVSYANKRSVLEGYEPCYDLGQCRLWESVYPRELPDLLDGPDDWIFRPWDEDHSKTIWDWNIRVLQACAVVATQTIDYDCEGYRLPTEAEWEFAARAGSRSDFWCDGAPSCVDAYAQTLPDPRFSDVVTPSFSTYPVGLLCPNRWGLYDIAGNSPEWTNDRVAEPFGWLDPWPSYRPGDVLVDPHRPLDGDALREVLLEWSRTWSAEYVGSTRELDALFVVMSHATALYGYGAAVTNVATRQRQSADWVWGGFRVVRTAQPHEHPAGRARRYSTCEDAGCAELARRCTDRRGSHAHCERCIDDYVDIDGVCVPLEAPRLGAPCRSDDECAPHICPTDALDPSNWRCAPVTLRDAPGGAMEFRYVPQTPPEGFLQGSPATERGRRDDEGPYEAHISRPFFVSRTPVTYGQWGVATDGVMPRAHPGCYTNPETPLGPRVCDPKAIFPDAPVAYVSLAAAAFYANWLSERDGLEPCYAEAEEVALVSDEVPWHDIQWHDGRAVFSPSGQIVAGEVWGWPNRGCSGYRLLTETEWEWAARAPVGSGTLTSPYYWGDAWDSAYALPSVGLTVTSPSGKRIPNGYGLHDVIGNVPEFVWDTYYRYPPVPKTDFVQYAQRLRSRVVLRGGDDPGAPFSARTAARRYAFRSEVRGGFRLARSFPE